MAKKKQIELTIEEKLQNALVPKEEQPYKIPSNWCWIRLLESFVNKTDSKKKIKQKDYLEEGNYPIVDQGRDLIGGYTNDDKLIIYIKKPIIVFGDHTRCIKYINFDFVQGADGTKILEPKKIFLEKYFYYAFKNINIPSLGYRRHYPMFNKLKIQIAPIDEQQRIVNRIEFLFAKLDRAKELIENTLAQFEQNKMAILHKAFTGELTVKWRKENNINEKNFFNKVKLRNVIKLISGRDVSVSLCNDKSIGIPYILGASNIKDNKFFIERWIENPVVVSEKNDILLSVKGTIGKLYLQKEEKINISRQIMALRALNDLNTHYLYYFLLRECERLKFEGNGLIPGISRKDILDLNILLPTLEEQQEIVNILDKLLAKYNKIKNLEQQLEKIELLKKAILAKAFRGELGTNNPDEESAENLLKEILAEK